jgi:hypothetical protein
VSVNVWEIVKIFKVLFKKKKVNLNLNFG